MSINLRADSFGTKTTKERPPVLYDLPVHVLGIVAGKLRLIDCLALRKVSRDLRDLVDSSELNCQLIEFKFGPNWRTMKLNNMEIRYRETKDGGCEITSHRKDTRKKNTYQDDRDFKEAMIADVATFLKNPKLKIGQMRFEGYWKAYAHFARFLKSLNLQLNVKSIRNRDLEFLHSIQECLNPEILEEISCNGLFSVDDFNQIADANLKYQKLKFEQITFDNYTDESSINFSKTLNSINSQPDLHSIVVIDGRWIPTVLRSLNPEKVEEVFLDVFDGLTADHFNEMKQWKTKTRLGECILPEWVGLEDLVDFKAIRSENFELTEENLIKIRDILLKSPHLELLELRSRYEHFEEKIRETIEEIDRIMSESPEYDSSTRRLSIPNSRDYFQLKFEKKWVRYLELTIKRTSPS